MAATADPSDLDLDLGHIPSLYKPASLLPISHYRSNLLYTIELHPVTILIGQTGSGKTTQLPQFLYQAGWCSSGGIIGVTQPRRVAVTTVANRVASELNCTVGSEVGYSIRFEDVTSSRTRIKFLTDGMLLREALVDPLLSRYSVIMVDEAHERSLSTDVLLGLLKKILKKRPDLKVVVSSATLQAKEFLKYFEGGSALSNLEADFNSVATVANDRQDAAEAKVGSKLGGRIVSIEGRSYPVDILYLEEPTENYLERAVQTVFQIHSDELDGDVLVFLTGREEIQTAIAMITEQSASLHPKAKGLQPLPLYAGLTIEQQMYVFEPAADNTRKVILSTNIAEASVTIDGIVFVIDTGFAKLRAYNPTTGIDSLTAVPISQASAQQRAGRAGRTKPGKCFRLYTEHAFQTSMAPTTPPEIQRSNLAPLVLQLKALGIDNIVRFDFLTPPPAELLIRAFDTLYSLSAIDEYAKLTKPLGTRMAELGSLDPMLARILLSAPSFGVLSEMLSIAAMISLQGSVWFSHDYDSDERKVLESARRKFAVEEGDHLTLLNVYQGFVGKGKKESKWCKDHRLNFKSMMRAVSIRGQLKRYLERLGVNADDNQGGLATGTVASANSSGKIAGAVPRAKATPEKAEQIRRCLTTGFFAHAAKMQADGTFKTVGSSGSTGLIVHAHPSSLMFNRKATYVIFSEIIETSGSASATQTQAPPQPKIYIRDITKIERAWLLEYSGEYYRST